jgi:hypothetical protein
MADASSASCARVAVASHSDTAKPTDRSDQSVSPSPASVVDSCRNPASTLDSTLPNLPPCSRSLDNDPKDASALSSDEASSGRLTNSPSNQYSDTDSNSNHHSNHVGNGTSDESSFTSSTRSTGRKRTGLNVAPQLVPHVKNDNPNRSKNKIERTDIQFRIGEKLEACDSTGTWYPAKIVSIDDNEQSVLIHFIRWSTRFDQWMQMDTDHLRPLPKMVNDSGNSNSEGSRKFQVGDNVLAIWTDNKKYPGRIQTVLSDGNYNILFFDGYRKKVRKNLVESLPADFDVGSAPITSMKSSRNSTPSSRKASIEPPPPSSVIPPSISNKPAVTISSPSTTTIITPTTPQPPPGKPGRKKASVTVTPTAVAPLVLPVASKEFVVEADHNQYKCTINECNKSFRKETLLNSHVKHYHPEYAPPTPIVNPSPKPESKETPSARRRSAVAAKSTSVPDDKDSDRSLSNSSTEKSDLTRDKSQEQSNGITKSISKAGKNKFDSTADSSLDASFEPPKDGEVFDVKSPAVSVKASLVSNQATVNTNGSNKKKRRSAPANRSLATKQFSENAIDSRSPLSKASHCESHEWSDSTVEDSLAGSESKVQSRKKRASQRRPNVSRLSSVPKSMDEDAASFDMDDECFESADESRANSPKKKKRFRRNDDINKQILNMKIDLQERRDRHSNEFQDEPFLSNTPSTSSASESALAESADFADFHAYDEKRFSEYSPSHEPGEHRAKKKKLIKPIISGKRSKPDYSNASSPLLATPLSTVLWAPFRRHVGLRSTVDSTVTTDLCTAAMSPLASMSTNERESTTHELPFWDARIVKDIHESDEVDELVHCICDYKEESGLMIQCEVCLTWQHGTCFEIEEEQQVPECYVCFACRDPRLGRESQRFIYDQELMSKGKFPLLPSKSAYLTEDQKRDRTQSDCNQKQMCSANQLLGIVVEISLILKSLRHKLNLIKENRVNEMHVWQEHIPRDQLISSGSDSVSGTSSYELKGKMKAIEDAQNGENEMMGDILNFSKNILETVPCANSLKTEDGIVEEELLKSNDDLDEATDLIDFITSAGKDNDKELVLGSEIKKEFIPIEEFKSEPLDKSLAYESHESKHSIRTPDAIDSKDRKHTIRPVDEVMLDHIVSVHSDLVYKLTLVEKKVLEIELEMGIDKNDERDLQDDLLLFKDTIKGIYRDLNLVKELTNRHSFLSNHL